jgi:phospholipase A1 protein A
MDWSVLCEFEYLSAINGARKAGKILAEFLNWLFKSGVELEHVHLIGHSLGAHVAGIAGHEIKNGKIGRITGTIIFALFQIPHYYRKFYLLHALPNIQGYSK